LCLYQRYATTATLRMSGLCRQHTSGIIGEGGRLLVTDNQLFTIMCDISYIQSDALFHLNSRCWKRAHDMEAKTNTLESLVRHGLAQRKRKTGYTYAPRFLTFYRTTPQVERMMEQFGMRAVSLHERTANDGKQESEKIDCS